MLPNGTPTKIMLKETGYSLIEHTINKKKIMQKARVEKMDNNKLVKKILQRENSKINTEMVELMEEYEITNQELIGNKYNIKAKIENKNKEKFNEIIHQEASQKSKTKHWNELTDKIQTRRPKYMDKLTRKQCSAIIKARCRVIPTKDNQPNMYTSDRCRLCKEDNSKETQKHILEECPRAYEEIGKRIKYEEIFKETSIENSKEIANHINLTIDLLEKCK